LDCSEVRKDQPNFSKSKNSSVNSDKTSKKRGVGGREREKNNNKKKKNKDNVP